MYNLLVSPDSQILQQLPSVGKLLERETIQDLIALYSRDFVVEVVQDCLEEFRTEIRQGGLPEDDIARRIAQLDDTIRAELQARISPSLTQVVNASGVIIHTNVGRAPLPPSVAQAVANIATGYSNLEYDVAAGKRGHRDSHVEKRICALLDCSAATVCNNNAAAVLLILNTLALGKKVLVSRGELVEIGGSFRIPAIMERSGAILKEVGTTNKTKISDYGEAIDDETSLILRVHPSNYRIIGFTQRPEPSELVALSRKTGIPLFEDVGSGLLFPSPHSFLQEEPSVSSILEEGVDLVSFSGDKLLGGPQAGIMAGKEELVGRIRRNPLMRACRLDKMTYSALEWTLIQYQKGTYQETVPVHQMLSANPQQIKERAQRLARLIDSDVLHTEIRPGESVIGGGSAPDVKIPTHVLAVTSNTYTVNEMERRLRQSPVPVVARIENNQLVLDLRTVFAQQEEIIVFAFAQIAARE